MNDLPINQMLADVTRLEEAIRHYEGSINSVAARVCRHVRELVAAYKQHQRMCRSGIEGDYIVNVLEYANEINGRVYKRLASDAARQVCTIEDQQKEIDRLRLFERAIESMADQFICPQMTAKKLAEQQLSQEPK